MRASRLRRTLVLPLFIVVLLIGACSAGGDSDVEPATSGDPPPTQTGSPAQLFSRDSGAAFQIVNPIDVVFNDVTNDRPAFALDGEPLYGDRPRPEFEPFVDGLDFDATIRANLRWLVDQGYDTVHLTVIDGYGGVLVPSDTLASLRHSGFDYDAQYDGDPSDGDLRIDEEDARQRYYIAGDVLPLVATEAHALGLTVEANIESLAHIINRAQGEGIGADEDAVLLAGNLPAPSIDQTLAFLDETIAAGADQIVAEAFPTDYDIAIADHLAARQIPYLHTGAGLGSVWVGYYYSLYPDSPATARAYAYQYTDDALLGSTNATIFARARALSDTPHTAVVVGAYNPVPCGNDLSIADLYSETRNDPDLPRIDNEFPRLADGTPVANCATDMWLNLLLIAARRQSVDVLRLTADIEPSNDAARQPGLATAIEERLAAHPAPSQTLPIANIVLDVPAFGSDDGYTNDEFVEIVSLTTLGLIDDALSAAGFLTVLTIDEPWRGGDVALTYIVTAGGNEDTDDGIGMGPPYWTDAQPLEPSLLALLEPGVHPGPIFLHPILGVPDSGNWRQIREQFALPPRFTYRNPSLSQFDEYHTSLLTSLPVDPDGETPDDADQRPLTPATGAVLGQTLPLTPYIDLLGIGQAANYLRPADIATSNVFASGPLLVPSQTAPDIDPAAPYLLHDNAGRFLWLINDLHHEAFTYIVGQAVAAALGVDPVLDQPVAAHVWSGRQTFALAFDDTDLSLNLPFETGELVDITVYDRRSQQQSQSFATPYDGPLHIALPQFALLVVEPAR